MEKNANILIILLDQLSWKALPAYGNKDCLTPNIDRIVKNGARFESCYTPCPLCQPARASFWTGLFPHQTGILSNGRKHHVPSLPESVPTVGSLFNQAGYDTVHFGKKHDAGSLRGFVSEPQSSLPVEGSAAWPVGEDTCRDRYTVEKVVQYLQQPEQEKPFFLVADLVNPHDICSWIGHNKGVHENVAIDVPLPPLPDNYEFEDIENRPLPVQYLCCSHNRQAQAAGWTAENYRYYLAAYYHYLQRADAEVGLILDALEKRSDAGKTLVVFMADHGDSMAAHGMVTKQVTFYEETTRVPFVFSGPMIPGKDRVISNALVSLMDLLPTLCDYSGISVPEGLWGKSLMPWLKEERQDSPHPYVVSEWHTEWGFTIEPGRMLRTPGYKYIRYREADGEELYDIKRDPGERKSLIQDPQYAGILQEHRRKLEEHLGTTGDDFLMLPWKADSRWRSHKPGYRSHNGPAAPMAGG